MATAAAMTPVQQAIPQPLATMPHTPAATSAVSALAQVACTPDGIHVSPLDEREYKYLQLANGLRALVVSDPTTESASAAMDVSVGFHSDPDAIPGLAHFCEHMLFLGTAKYPDENSYSSFLSAHGGSSNAYTSARHTNYYFDVAAPHLAAALDRFAQFFIAPLFTASATDRELRAVDSEATNYLQDDDWRIDQVARSLGNLKHPHHRFGVGNLTTLSTTPAANGIDVRAALLAFHATHYAAHRMTLVVYGREDVATLVDTVTTLFSAVCDSQSSTKPVFGPELPFTPLHLGRRLDVVPVKDLNVVAVAWQLTPLRGPNAKFTQQHVAMLAHCIGHEGHGSLLSLLKQAKLVNGLSAGIDDDHDEFGRFVVHIDVTDDGIAHVDEIVLALFQYLVLLQPATSALEQWRFDELEALAVQHFVYQSKAPPSRFTSTTASAMQLYALRDVLTHNALACPNEPDCIDALLQQLTPAAMQLMVVSKTLATIAIATEPWYGTKYRDAPLSADLLAKLSTPGANTALMLPTRNAFIATDVALIDRNAVGAASRAPALVRDDATCRVWCKPDVHFCKPKLHAALTFHSPLVNSSPLAFVLSDLLVLCVQDELTEFAYDATLAGMHYDIAVHGSALHVGAVGYSAKLPLLLDRVVECMATVRETVAPATFARVQQAATRAYENVRRDEAFHHAMHATTCLLQDNTWTNDELIAAVAQCTLPMLVAHSESVCTQVYLEALLYGNILRSDALAIIDLILKRMPTTQPVVASQRFLLPRQVALPTGVTNVFATVDANPANANCALDVVYQVGVETPWTRVCLALFAQIANEPLFHALRTVEQLGYTVFSTPARASGVQFFRVLVQSNVASPVYLAQRVDAFWQRFRSTLVQIDAQTFDKHVQAIVKEYAEAPKSQEEEVHLLINEIRTHEYAFDRRHALAALVVTVQRTDVLQFFDDFVSPSAQTRKTLRVEVYGNATPLVELTVDDGSNNNATVLDRSCQTGVLAAMGLGAVCAAATPVETTQRIVDLHAFKRSATYYGLPPSVVPALA